MIDGHNNDNYFRSSSSRTRIVSNISGNSDDMDFTITRGETTETKDTNIKGTNSDNTAITQKKENRTEEEKED